MLAVNTQQELGLAFVAVLVIGWFAYLVVHIRRPANPPGAEIELAPNRRPYLDDDAMEGPRLERVLGWSMVLMVIVAIGLPLYWLKEPGRQKAALVGFNQRAAQRGFILFQPTDSPIPEGNIGHFGCGKCHGVKGDGGVTTFTITDELGRTRAVSWKVPALNTVLLRFAPAEVTQIITYGRPGTPMPAWGLAGGGPMNDQQISDLVSYLQTIQLKPADVKKTDLAQYGLNGANLFDAFCSRCHTKGWSFGEPKPPGSGAFGPNLTNGDTLRQFPDIQKHIDFVTAGSDDEKNYGARGVGTGRMPGFGEMLTPEQIQAIVNYERSL